MKTLVIKHISLHLYIYTYQIEFVWKQAYWGGGGGCFFFQIIAYDVAAMLVYGWLVWGLRNDFDRAI